MKDYKKMYEQEKEKVELLVKQLRDKIDEVAETKIERNNLRIANK